ncbi:MAG: DUF1127 domain-containing protein [Rhizobiaceae bacterium]|nr:DUF1127 domain-containing protein [Rhizobiaceae bacterium]
MTTIEQSHFETRAARQAVATRIVNAVWKSIRLFRNRRAIYQLGELSDAHLADIGLRRSDLHVAISSPFGIDPTAQLGTLAGLRAEEALARQVS